MLEIRSAIADCKVPGRYGAGASSIAFAEKPIGCLIQVAGWPGRFELAATKIMQRLGFAELGGHRMAQGGEKKAAFRIAPENILLILSDRQEWEQAATDVDPSDLATLDLSQAKARIAISGKDARNLLVRVLPIDLHDGVFEEGHFAQTGLHSVSVLLHRLRDRENTAAYDLYVPYTWAVSVWHALTANALPFGYEVVDSPKQ
jgi:sarcosine oxidase subunit gamma